MDDAVPEGLPPTLTAAQLGWLLDLSPGRLTQLIPVGIVFRTERDTYDVRSIRNFVRWQRQSSAAGNQAWNDARTSLALERATIARLDREEREGELIPVKEVIAINTTIAARVRDLFLGVPARLAVRVAAAQNPAEAEQIMYAAVVEVLEELSAMQAVAKSAPAARRRRDRRSAESRTV
jgi:hypothetical protein